MQANEMKVEKGQTVYLKPIGNQGRRSSEIEEAKVTSVGNKYIHVDIGYGKDIKISIGTMKEHSAYTPNWMLHLTKEEIEIERETERMYKQLEDMVRRRVFSYEQLKSLTTTLK